MGGFFRGRGDGATKLDKELATLESQIRSASSGYETQFLNRAGNLCFEAGDSARAVVYYGRAIDAYLESGRFNAAEVLCRKVLQISPNTVRARCTLTWLAIGKNDPERVTELAAYVAAAERAGQQVLAIKQLSLMADAVSEIELRETIAKHLLHLEAPEKADEVFGLVFEARDRETPPSAPDEGKLWSKLLRAALMAPKELQLQTWASGEEEGDNLPSLLRRDPP